MTVIAPGPRRAAPALAFCAFLLAGCAGFGPAARQALEPFDAPVRVEPVAFFPQTELHCGPAALASVLETSGRPVNYSDLVDRVYLPDRGGTLQVELLAAARSHDRIPWVLAPQLSSLLAEVAAGRPVLVLENQGVRGLPYWHYAVVIGFDPERADIIQHSGTEAELARPMRRWLRDWTLAGRWAVVTLPPDQLPRSPERERWLQTLADFEAVAEPRAALLAWQTAAERWPDEPLVWLGQGNSRYRLGALDEAIAAFEQALKRNPDQPAAAYNLAVVLLENDQPCRAAGRLDALRQHPVVGERAAVALETARESCNQAR